MAKKKITCPICGQTGTEETLYAIKDGMICGDCAEKLKVMYPCSYTKNYGYQVRDVYHEKTLFSDGYTTLEDNGQLRFFTHYKGLEELTVAEYPEKLASLEAYRAQLRRQYGAEAAFTVQTSMEIKEVSPFDVGIPKMRKFKNTFCYCGSCIVGEFAEGDSVILFHGGKEFRTRVLYAALATDYDFIQTLNYYYNRKSGNSLANLSKDSSVTEGDTGYMILEKGTPEPAPGDIIIKL